jgi:predicted nuclease with TOPRIM domain
MHYKSIVLELLEDRPRLKERLQRERQLLLTLEIYAQELKAGHEAWKTRLTHMRPESSPLQIASEALELALSDLEQRLPSESNADDETFSLDAAMACRRRPSSDD